MESAHSDKQAQTKKTADNSVDDGSFQETWESADPQPVADLRHLQGRTMSPKTVMRLQGQVGNQATLRMLDREGQRDSAKTTPSFIESMISPASSSRNIHRTNDASDPDDEWQMIDGIPVPDNQHENESVPALQSTSADIQRDGDEPSSGKKVAGKTKDAILGNFFALGYYQWKAYFNRWNEETAGLDEDLYGEGNWGIFWNSLDQTMDLMRAITSTVTSIGVITGLIALLWPPIAPVSAVMAILATVLHSYIALGKLAVAGRDYQLLRRLKKDAVGYAEKRLKLRKKLTSDLLAAAWSTFKAVFGGVTTGLDVGATSDTIADNSAGGAAKGLGIASGTFAGKAIVDEMVGKSVEKYDKSQREKEELERLNASIEESSDGLGNLTQNTEEVTGQLTDVSDQVDSLDPNDHITPSDSESDAETLDNAEDGLENLEQDIGLDVGTDITLTIDDVVPPEPGLQTQTSEGLASLGPDDAPDPIHLDTPVITMSRDKHAKPQQRTEKPVIQRGLGSKIKKKFGSVKTWMVKKLTNFSKRFAKIKKTIKSKMTGWMMKVTGMDEPAQKLQEGMAQEKEAMPGALDAADGYIEAEGATKEGFSELQAKLDARMGQ